MVLYYICCFQSFSHAKQSVWYEQLILFMSYGLRSRNIKNFRESFAGTEGAPPFKRATGMDLAAVGLIVSVLLAPQKFAPHTRKAKPWNSVRRV